MTGPETETATASVGSGTVGAPDWVDLSTPDLERARAFYASLLGWTMTETPMPEGPYVIATVADGQQVGGMMQDSGPEGPPAWTTFFRVEDVDAAVTAVQRLGGSLLQPAFALPDTTRVAVVEDPTGAVLGLLSGPVPTGPPPPVRPGAVCWSELLTRDTAAAEAFYAALFGWRAVREDVEGSAYTTFRLEDRMIAGLLAMPAEVPAEAPASWAVYFSVTDCAATERRTGELGGQVLVPTMAVGDMRFAVLADPFGAVFDVLEEVSA